MTTWWTWFRMLMTTEINSTTYAYCATLKIKHLIWISMYKFHFSWRHENALLLMLISITQYHARIRQMHLKSLHTAHNIAEFWLNDKDNNDAIKYLLLEQEFWPEFLGAFQSECRLHKMKSQEDQADRAKYFALPVHKTVLAKTQLPVCVLLCLLVHWWWS